MSDKEKEEEVVLKPIPRSPPLFSQQLRKKADDAKFSKFLAMIKQLTINKKSDPGAVTIPCIIGTMEFTKALCDLGASVNLMPLTIYKKLGQWNPTPTNIRLVMADRSVKRPVGILYDALVKVSNFIFPVDFIILDCEVDFEVPIILGQPFLAIGSVFIDLRVNELLFKVNDIEVQFDVGNQ
ncbi:uncharacterized protein LOC124889649 [Capsicum annuum]|uniref:uncharacterized protein LOC124889649 n=1 Tax=Capsicum annuum TaxID=4072 RepID=UPI001FB058EC|nr:uncharacterized protein LOC124889649 [Capsicum annuum]